MLLWLYRLVPVPLLTDRIESGALPFTLRGWLTEIAGGLIIAALVTRVRCDHRALDKLARYDGLTGLANRRVFEAAIEAECARARRSRVALSIVYLDIDGFKAINDRFGHGAGDQVLRQIATAIGETVRVGGDGGYRLGGDTPASSSSIRRSPWPIWWVAATRRCTRRRRRDERAFPEQDAAG